MDDLKQRDLQIGDRIHCNSWQDLRITALKEVTLEDGCGSVKLLA